MKKILLTAFVVLSAMVLSAQNNKNLKPIIENVYAREVVSLNGKWNRLIDPLESGYWDYRKKESANGYFKDTEITDRFSSFKEYDFDSAPALNVPGDWNTQESELFYYENTVWYKKSFTFEKVASERVYLYFGAANYEAKVYVNGEKAGEHEGGYTPFNFDVTDLLKDGENFVVVKVDNRRRADAVPTDNFDWWNYGGLTRDVMLVRLPETFIENYKVQLRKGESDIIDVKVKLSGSRLQQHVTVEIPEINARLSLTTDASGTACGEIRAKGLSLWSPENPKLYDVKLRTSDETVSDNIGFRNIETRGNKILLNGEEVFLKGICIHEEAPLRGARAYSEADAVMLLDMAQELGCNYVRLAHYPHNEYMTREADRRGIMVWSEIPVYWTIAWENPTTYANAQNQLDEMIERDENRASIIIWSVANETPHSEPRDRFLASLTKYARNKDDTRLISLAMEKQQNGDGSIQEIKDNMHEYVDVISCNQYIGWYDDTYLKCDRVEWKVEYDKPVIISEMGGAALYGLHGDKTERWSEEYQAELYRRSMEMVGRIPNLAGVTPWIMMDFRSSKRLLPQIQDGFNRKGVYSDKGEKKQAFYVLKQWYSER